MAATFAVCCCSYDCEHLPDGTTGCRTSLEEALGHLCGQGRAAVACIFCEEPQVGAAHVGPSHEEGGLQVGVERGGGRGMCGGGGEGAGVVGGSLGCKGPFIRREVYRWVQKAEEGGGERW